MTSLFYVLWYFTGLCGAMGILQIFQLQWERMFKEPRPFTYFDFLMILMLGFSGPVGLIMGLLIYINNYRKLK